MSDGESPIDLSEPEEKKSFPWLLVAILLASFGAAAAFIVQNRSSGTRAELATLQDEIKKDKALMEEERDKVFEITERLNALKQSIALRQVKDHEGAVREYNKLAAEQRTQRQKVKDLAEQFNAKLARANELQ
jgi:hypothetical protein